jgi:opacity protein-like surface antigen
VPPPDSQSDFADQCQLQLVVATSQAADTPAIPALSTSRAPPVGFFTQAGELDDTGIVDGTWFRALHPYLQPRSPVDEGEIQMSSKSPWTALACAGVLFASSAQAMEPGWYLFAFGGESSASGASENRATENLVAFFEANGITVLDSTADIDDSDTGLGLGGGYQLNDHFALEFAYVDLGSATYDFTATLEDEDGNQANADVEFESSADGPVFSALGIWPIGERFSVFGRAGFSLLNAKGTARVTIDDQAGRDSQESQKFDPMFGIGAEYNIGKHFAVRLAWDRYLDVGTSNTTGDIDSDVISLGVRMNTGWFR